MATAPRQVYLEVGSKRVFAGALHWPGWARSGKGEAAALEALAAYGPRYAAVLEAAGVGGFTAPGGSEDLEVVERVDGDATTDFGAPGAPATLDAEPLDGEELTRYLAVLQASWDALDRASQAARGIALRKGPRGGGRNRVAIVEHVVGAEEGYLASLGGIRPKVMGLEARTGAMRRAVATAIGARAAGEPLPEGRRSKKAWTPRYGVRRVAWHALDHAWEIEDRAVPAG